MLSIVLIGVSLAMDAFAISLTYGLTIREFRLRHALYLSAYFAVFQFLMPLIGCFLAGTVSDYISKLGPYISFFLLAFIGGKMLVEALHGESEEGDTCGESITAKMHPKRLIALAVATSIDALAVGVSFAFMDVALLPSCLIIGGVTFVICVGGGMLGRYIPWLTGKRAEIFGGLILIGIGIKLLIEGIFL
ncbi:MAG: manganese efflux pump MntP family protein [Oscillospiraceae bacterium]|jgi:putative Mn2+ efflux pump MntP